MNPQSNEWLLEYWPKVRFVDKNGTMERYDYPQEVRDWIETNWIKINDDNGGTWSEPKYHMEKKKKQECGKKFAEDYKKTGLHNGMDELNKKALDVMATEGMDSAIKHMFTDQETGNQLSYGAMRTRYG
jgi:hypothetical protein